ncbi:MAG: 3-deoxy-8-phosphooctulonate synthase [Rhodospirillales bacterium]
MSAAAAPRTVTVNTASGEAGAVAFANNRPFALIAGPCAMESRDHALDMAGAVAEITAALGLGFVYKSSFDKANRTSASGKRGLGLDAALKVFAEVRQSIGCPVLTDVHEPHQCAEAAAVVDVLQIPAFLCRQTDLLTAAGRTGKAVNIKKGQFLAPWDMTHAAAKVADTGNKNILLTERGASFGYNTLVVDFRGLPVMAASGWPVIFDATHSVQQPGGQGAASGGDRRFAPVLARAAAAAGVAGIFAEVHQDPDNAPSDGPNMIKLKDLRQMLETLVELDRITKANPVGPIA